MKKILFAALALLIGSGAAAADRVAQTVLAVTLQHGEAVSVRRSLETLHAGDFVTRLEGYARATRPGSYLEVIFDNRIVGHIALPLTMTTFTVPVNARNGVDYQSFYLRAVGSVYIDSIEAYISAPRPPLEPVPPHPGNPPPPLEPVPPHPGNPDASLGGSCAEPDHRQYFAARNFAHSMRGLALPLNAAETWAADYNRSHACGTIGEFQNRFMVLRDLAAARTGLSLTPAEATEFALTRAETTRLEKARELGPALNAIRDFAYSSYGLGLSPVDSAQLGRDWILRGSCENATGIAHFGARYRAEFDYAYSHLQYDGIRAKEYALARTRSLSVCGDLLR